MGCSASEEESMKEKRVFPGVSAKSLGRPSPRSLNQGWRDTIDSKVSSTTRTQGLARNIFWKEAGQALDEPRARGNFSAGPKPELRIEREKLIARAQVVGKGKVRVRGVMDALDDETASLESGISLVRRQPKRECARKPLD
jgi:hypothetical protein